MSSPILTQEPVGRSLILAGGGMRLAYQAGVLIALEEENMKFNHVDGTSGGIFNAAMLASGLHAHEMASRWRSLDIKDFMSMRPWKNYFKPFYMKGYADADGIREKIFPALGIDIHKINTCQLVNATFNVCNFSDKSVEAIAHQDVKEDHLIAGVSLPIVMPGLRINDHWYSDAVWIKDANLMEAVKRGAHELWLVWAIGNTEKYLPGLLNQYVHMIEMSANGGLIEEYERIHLINQNIENGESTYGQTNPVKLFVLKPDLPLPLDPDLFFNKIDARALINMGYAHAKKSLSSIPDNGVPFTTEATKMRDPGARLNIMGEFNGILTDEENRRHHANFYVYMVLSHYPNKNVLYVFSSIKVDLFDHEIPGYDSRIETHKNDHKLLLECQSSFLVEKERFSLAAKFELSSEIDLLLGLEFKSVNIRIIDENGSRPLLEGKLYQNIKNRLNSWYSTHTRRQDGTSGGIKLKYKMASKLMAYAV